MLIQVYIRSVYGVDRVYPANDAALVLAELLRRKTIEQRELECVRKLGHVVEVVADPRVTALMG